MPIEIEEQIGAVERELRMREKVYPRWVKAGKLSRLNAEAEMARMQAVLTTLKQVQAGQDVHVRDAEAVRRGERARLRELLLPCVYPNKVLYAQQVLKDPA